jgi:hypothetical protein
MKNIFLAYWIIILSSNLLFSQNNDCLSVDTCISYNKIVKNVTAYHIRYASASELGIVTNHKTNKTNFLEVGNYRLNFMPETNDMILQLNFTRTAFIYPDTTFKVYSFFLSSNNWKFGTTTEAFRRTNKQIVIHPSMVDYHGSLYADNHYLVAFNGSTIKFISGNFFKSFLSIDFQLKGDNYQKYDNYIKMRVYQWIKDVSSITFIEKKKGYLYFKVTDVSREILIKIDETYPDYYEIEPLKGKF